LLQLSANEKKAQLEKSTGDFHHWCLPWSRCAWLTKTVLNLFLQIYQNA